MPMKTEMTGLRWRDRYLLRIPSAWIERMALLSWGAKSLVSSTERWNARLRYELGADTDPAVRANIWRIMASEQTEYLIDRRLYLDRLYGRESQWPELDFIAKSLAATIHEIHRKSPGRAVIVSPFHYVSEYANIIVVDFLRAALGLSELAVVSGSPRESYGQREDILIPNLRILHTRDDDNRSALGLRLMRSIKQNGAAVLFSDVPPYMMQRYPMDTIEVSILGRPARLHHGVFSIGSHIDAVLLCFHLTFKNGHFDHRVFPFIELGHKSAPQQLATYIEEAYRSAYPNWILASHPSLYGFSPSK